MPRIYASNSYPLDFCKACFRNHSEDDIEPDGMYGINVMGEGPDGRGDCSGFDEDHPDYDDDPGFYECEDCGVVLKGDDY